MANSTQIRDIYVTANGIRHHLLARGEPGHPAVVLLHSSAGQAHVFDHAAELLAERFHVYALDFRGRGESGWGPPSEYNTTTYANDLEAVRAALGLHHFALVGTWRGALVALQYAAQHPEHVDRVVVNDIGPDVAAEGRERLSHYLTESPDAFPDLKSVVNYFRAYYGPMLDQLAPHEFEEFARWHVRRNDLGLYTWKYDPALRRQEEGAPEVSHWDAFYKVTCPIMIVRGRTASLLSVEEANQMLAAGDHVSLFEIDGTGHAPTMVDDRVITAVEHFLAQGAPVLQEG